MQSKHSVGLIVPIFNPGPQWPQWLSALEKQSLQPSQTLVIDSESSDASADQARQAGLTVVTIPKASFSHGGTRQMGLDALGDADIVVFLTQDAILSERDSLLNLTSSFEDSAVGAAYGRQLPRIGASAIEAHARLFNYPDRGRLISCGDIQTLGIKAAFLSNSFAAYRRAAIASVEGFKTNLIMGEDMVASAQMLLNGWKIAYRADAHVFHSHSYSVSEEFMRYFDTGVLHARERWLVEKLGSPRGEGLRFICSELSYLWQAAPFRIPESFVRSVLKALAYVVGRNEARLAISVKRALSMHKQFWLQHLEDELDDGHKPA
jgi:rhamnosyltransferase